MKEHDIAKELWKWRNLCLNRYPCLEVFHHIPNEGKRNPAIAKSEGIVAGLPDYHLPVPCGHFGGFFLELKAPGRKPTRRQLWMMERLEKWGNYVCWTDNLSRAIELTERYCRGVHGLDWKESK